MKHKKRLVWSIIFGSLMGFLWFKWLQPQDTDIILIRNSNDASYHASENEDYDLEIQDLGHGVIKISHEPHADPMHYMAALLIGVIMGLSQYRRPETKPPAEHPDDITSPNHNPHPDPIYEAFLQEDTNRRLFPRPDLEEEFQAWESKQ